MVQSSAVVIYFISLAIGASATLKCYVCNGCNDQFNWNEARSMNCSGSCGKTKRDDSGYVKRFCNPVIVYEPKCESLDSATDDDIEACACNTDLCNAAATTGLSLQLQIICGFVSFFCYFGEFFKTSSLYHDLAHF